MKGRTLLTWLRWALLAAPVALASAGCSLDPVGSPSRPRRAHRGARPVRRRLPDVPRLAGGRALRDERAHDQGHPLRAVPHAPGGHPNFTQPVRDAKCGGCHQPQYQQTLVEQALRDARARRALDGDRAARDGAPTGGLHRGRRRAADAASSGDSSSGELGGRLCAACHYDEHRLDLAAVRRDEFCVSCHAGTRRPFRRSRPPSGTNRCVQCHVRVGETVTGQVVNTHRFARPGAEGSGQ